MIPLLAATVAAGKPHSAIHFVPYEGSLAGTVTIDFTPPDGPAIHSQIREASSHLGTGSQEFTSLDLSGFPQVASGTSVAIAANGDELFLEFSLVATTVVPTPIGLDLEYGGEYRITGGTGRFDFHGPTPTGDYGSGEIHGMATVDLSTPGLVVMTFADSFEGTIAAVGCRK